MNSTFWIGVIENINDPLMLGRVQVRIVGKHSEMKVRSESSGKGIPTEDLPWAYPMQGITSAAMNGIGDSPTGMVQGTWVVGMSRDGELLNDLIVFGSIGGIPESAANTNVGFADPSGEYPKSDYIGEPDTNRLARGVSSETITASKNASRETGIPRAAGGSWSEPESPYGAVYPNNMVFESRSGHVTEVDDTPGAERLHEYHKSGSYREIDAAGNRVTKIVGDDYEIVVQDKKVYVKGTVSITVDGDAQIYAKEDITVKSNTKIEMEAPAIRIKGPVTQTGGDMTSDGVSAQHHTHGGVRTGSSSTQEPN